MNSAFYLAAINKKSLEVYSWIELPSDDVSKLYGDIDLTRQALEKLEAQFETPELLERSVFRVIRREYQQLSKAVLDFGKEVQDRNDFYISLSNKPPGDISKETFIRGREIARSQEFLGGAFEG